MLWMYLSIKAVLPTPWSPRRTILYLIRVEWPFILLYYQYRMLIDRLSRINKNVLKISKFVCGFKIKIKMFLNTAAT